MSAKGRAALFAKEYRKLMQTGVDDPAKALLAVSVAAFTENRNNGNPTVEQFLRDDMAQVGKPQPDNH